MASAWGGGWSYGLRSGPFRQLHPGAWALGSQKYHFQPSLLWSP